MILLIWAAVLGALLAIYLNKLYSRFSDYGVKHTRVVPFIGNIWRLFFNVNHFVEDMQVLYETFPEERFIGRYELLQPTLMIRDLDLVKKITIKDIEHFLDHRRFTDEKVEPIFSRSLFSLRGQEWKDMRSTLSPAFTGTKIKLMEPFMEEVGQQTLKILNQQLKESNTEYVDIDCKDLTSRYANDVIASCAFGLKVDSHTSRNNKFYEMGKLATALKFRQKILFFLMSAFPSLVRKLKVTLFPSITSDYFTELVVSVMKNREINKIVRPDMIHLLMQANKGQLSHDEKSENGQHKDAGFASVQEFAVGKKNVDRVWSEIDLVAQAMTFLIAGFETTSTAMCFALLELALHPEIQDRLAKEIKEVDAKNGGKITLNSIQSMTYLDMVVSEVLRIWPPMIFLDRVCTEDYNMGKSNAEATQDYIVRKGELVIIPIWSIHHNPELFPNPFKFDPERFSEENKHEINPVAYMPFGLGPRNCIGGRFALFELKSFLYQILLKYEVSVSVKTRLPSKLSKESILPRLEGGHWLRFKERQ